MSTWKEEPVLNTKTKRKGKRESSLNYGSCVEGGRPKKGMTSVLDLAVVPEIGGSGQGTSLHIERAILSESPPIWRPPFSVALSVSTAHKLDNLIIACILQSSYHLNKCSLASSAPKK